MELCDLEQLCKLKTVLTNIPLHIFSEDACIFSTKRQISPLKVQEIITDNRDMDSFFFSDDRKEFWALFQVCDTAYEIVAGPMMTNLSMGSDEQETRDCRQNMNDFLFFLSELYLSVNHRPLDPDKILGLNHDNLEQLFQDATICLLSENEQIFMDEKTKHTTQEYEEKLFYYIKMGQKNNLSELLFHNIPGNVGRVSEDQIRQDKNMAIISIALASRAAISGGMNMEAAYQLSDFYIRNIEKCRDSKIVLKYNVSALLDFCERVQNINRFGVRHAVIQKAMEYIDDNIQNKISVSDMAQYLYVSRNYLSKRFKEETGITIKDYILLQKNLEAKKLIRYTDKALAEISNQLCFSSQSYFQNQFKKMNGYTPLEYRNRIVES